MDANLSHLALFNSKGFLLQIRASHMVRDIFIHNCYELSEESVILRGDKYEFVNPALMMLYLPTTIEYSSSYDLMWDVSKNPYVENLKYTPSELVAEIPKRYLDDYYKHNRDPFISSIKVTAYSNTPDVEIFIGPYFFRVNEVTVDYAMLYFDTLEAEQRVQKPDSATVRAQLKLVDEKKASPYSMTKGYYK